LGGAGDPHHLSRSLFMEGEMAYSADTVKKYREILELDPGSRVFAMLAEELCAAGEWEEAAEVCRKGLVFHPDHLVARMLLGRALMEAGDPEEAEPVLLNVAEEIRKNSVIFKLLSELSALSGKTDTGYEYARMYEAFAKTASVQTPAAQTEALDSLPVLENEAVQPPEPDDFDMDALEAIEALEALEAATEAADTVDTTDTLPSEIQGEVETGRKIGLEDILENLVRRFEDRLTNITEPAALLSENDKDALKQRIMSLLGC
jgi:tetratricopeptide (TPR) repeat protein